MNILDSLNQHHQIFIIPLDHPVVEDTPKLISLGKQNFVNLIDNLNHDGYIFHSREYLDKPIQTNKDFFLTVGELPDNYLCDINKLKKFPKIKHLTIYFDVEDVKDIKPYKFYKSYVEELKRSGYLVMAMAYPTKKDNMSLYQHTIDLANQLGCDAIKTDLVKDINKLNLNGMKLFIAGGKYLSEDSNFEKYIKDVAELKIANCSFGRNIFESNNYIQRIKTVLNFLGR